MAMPSATTSTGAYSYAAGNETSHKGVYNLDDSNPKTSIKTEGNYQRRWQRHGEVFFRSIGLQSINNFMPWRRFEEYPKIAIEQNRWIALIRSVLHIVPLTGCCVLLVLSAMTTLVDPNSAFSILQFAAKVHETLIQASIATILLSHVRYEITQHGRVPSGSLFAAAQILSFGYLWSPEMVGTMKSRGMIRTRKFALVLHVLFAIILATAVGPSSVILMIPRSIHPLFGQCTVTIPTMLDTLYPSRLSLETPGRSDFLAEYESITSAPLQLTADAMRACSTAAWDTYKNYISLEMKQPFVWLDYCQPMPILNMNSSSQLKISAGFGGPSIGWTYVDVGLTLGDFDESYAETNNSHILWVAPPKEFNQSISIVAVAPDLKDMGTGVSWYWTCPITAGWLPATVNTSESFQVQAYPTDCTNLLDSDSFDKWLASADIFSIDPAWAYNATTYADLFKQSIGSTTLNNLLALAYTPADDGKTPWNGTNKVTPPELTSLVIGGVISTAMSTALTVNAANITYVNTTYKRTDESMPQGIFISDITSNPQGPLYNESKFGPGIISEEEGRLLAEQDPSRSFTIVVFGKSLTGYAFETLPVKIATVIICIYGLYVLVSIFASIIVGISSSSWGPVSEITALALNSTPPTDLGSIGAGLNTLRIFQEPAGILSNEKDDLELVFMEGSAGLEAFKALEKNKDY